MSFSFGQVVSVIMMLLLVGTIYQCIRFLYYRRIVRKWLQQLHDPEYLAAAKRELETRAAKAA